MIQLGDDIIVGGLKIPNSEAHQLLRQILGQNYHAGSSEAELKLFPELPLSYDNT